MQQLNTQHIVHPLTQNTIKSFKSRAQVIFNLLEKAPPLPPRWFTKFEFFSLFYIISTQRTYIYIYQKLDTKGLIPRALFLGEIFRLFLLNCEQSSRNNLFEWSQFKRNRRNNSHFAKKKHSWNQALIAVLRN